ncbi:Rho GDP-dissociation inhibitor, putative [Ricinus communis]|uniref:Rho GDP-dissociation inhibitor, putative n=1 Tax=Ricinus communis TaxID=3988 RepID=B9SKQ5_RICCO|nr:Rho GDP-dissociation inhibitor, putative [Ricinus communis]|eukprot:XP_002526574.1 rho GDP-dissociation inhibitor 1 [Ricinus communis]
MEGEKGLMEAAGPSSTKDCGVVSEKQEIRQEEMAENLRAEEAVIDDVGDDDDDNEEEEEITNGVPVTGFVPGPLLSLKDQIDKDKDDDSLRRWKEKLLGCVESELNGQMEPEVKFHSIGIISNDLEEINTPLPVDANRSGRLLFTLKEGSRYQLKLTFSVLHNIVSGLTYSNTVWKGGLQVDKNKGMLGTFAPQREPYVHTLEEETTPSGVLARGTYSAKLKFEDDDRRCHMELKYSFEIKKNK